MFVSRPGERRADNVSEQLTLVCNDCITSMFCSDGFVQFSPRTMSGVMQTTLHRCFCEFFVHPLKPAFILGKLLLDQLSIGN